MSDEHSRLQTSLIKSAVDSTPPARLEQCDHRWTSEEVVDVFYRQMYARNIRFIDFLIENPGLSEATVDALRAAERLRLGYQRRLQAILAEDVGRNPPGAGGEDGGKWPKS